MTVMFRSLLAVEIQSRVEGGSLAHGTSTPSPSFLTGTKTRHRARLVIAPRPAQEGTSLVPKHTKVPIELRRRRHRMGVPGWLFFVDFFEKSRTIDPAHFFSTVARFSNADAGGLMIPLRLNGAASKSICGGN